MERQTGATIDGLQLSDPGENLKVRCKERELTVSLLFSLLKTEVETSVSVPKLFACHRRKNPLLVPLEGGMCKAIDTSEKFPRQFAVSGRPVRKEKVDYLHVITVCTVFTLYDGHDLYGAAFHRSAGK
jgi:hypothetical protein